MARSVGRNGTSSVPKPSKKETMPSNGQSKSGAKLRLKTKRVTRSHRAQVTFPVGRLHRKLRKAVINKRIGVGASVFMAGVLDYLAAEFIDVAGRIAKETKKTRINPRHVMLAARGDEDFAQMFSKVVIAEGGVPVKPIHAALLPKK